MVPTTKDKIIGKIKEFFDKKFIETIARTTKFLQRESKLQGIIFFFYVYLPQRKRER